MTAQQTIDTTSPSDTQAIGNQIGQLLCKAFRAEGQQSDGPLLLIALDGELGAGKTTLTQGIAAGLGIKQTVTSPTFTLVNEYETADGLHLIHMDSYRLGDPSAPIESADDSATNEIVMDAATFGLEEVLETDDAIIVIEWAARLASVLPPDLLHIQLAYAASGAEGRSFVFNATGPQSTALVQKLFTSYAS